VFAVWLAWGAGCARVEASSAGAWGRDFEGQTTVPGAMTNPVAVAAGYYHSLALLRDGSVRTWGDTNSGQGTVPGSATNLVGVAAGAFHNLGLTSGGKVVGWGRNAEGQGTAPATLSNVVAVAAGREFSVALREDGTAVGWGGDWFGQVGGAFSLTGGVMLAAGREHALVVTSTNAWPRLARVAAVFGKRGEAVSTNLVAVPAGAVVSASALPAGLSLDGTNGLLSGISMLGGTALAQLRATNDEALTVGVVRVGIYPFVSLIDAPSAATSNFTQNATNVVRVATYGTHTAAVRANGTVVEWGKMGTNATLPAQPAGLSNVVDVVTGADFTIALKRDGRLAQWGTGLGSTAYTLVTNAVWIRASANWVAVLLSQGTNWTWMVSGSGGEYINAAPGSGFVDVAMAQFDQWALRPDGTKASSSIYAPPTAVARALYGGPRTIFQVGPDGIVSGMDV
jgi:alpha-tubulin suppressor-like RCC1 family protein